MRLRLAMMLLLLAMDLPVQAQGSAKAARFDEMARRMERLMKAWLAAADQRTLLLLKQMPLVQRLV